MKYRIEITDEMNQPPRLLLVEFRDDAAAIRFADRIAKRAKDQRIELWGADRLVKVHPSLGPMKRDDAASRHLDVK